MKNTKNYIREHNLLIDLIETLKKKNQIMFNDENRELDIEEVIKSIREVDRMRMSERVLELDSIINDCEVNLRDSSQMYSEDVDTMKNDLFDAIDEKDKLHKLII